MSPLSRSKKFRMTLLKSPSFIRRLLARRSRLRRSRRRRRRKRKKKQKSRKSRRNLTITRRKKIFE